MVYSSGNGQAQHFTGQGSIQAVDVELADHGRKIQLIIHFDMDV